MLKSASRFGMCLAVVACAVTFLTSRTQTTSAFQAAAPIARSSTSWKSTTRFDTSLADVKSEKESDPLSYSERSRVYRRDFFTHDSWLRHRSKDRYLGTFIKLFQSGVVRQLADEVLLIGIVATFVVLYNSLCVTGWDDFSMYHHNPLVNAEVPLFWLPVEGFSLSSPALGLLLVFKTNTSYQRWDEARKAWGVIVNNSRTVIRESAAWIIRSDIPDEEKLRLGRRVADTVWLFPRSMRRHLLQAVEDEQPYIDDVREKLSPELAEDMVEARHKPTRALFEMSTAVSELPLDTIQRSTIDQAVSQLCDASGGCERIFGSPVPLTYTRHTARFLELWLLFLPLALYKPFAPVWNHWAMIPVSMVVAFFFLGIEELSIQLEEPFSVLPLDKIAGGIGLAAEEHYQWLEAELAKKKSTSPLPTPWSPSAPIQEDIVPPTPHVQTEEVAPPEHRPRGQISYLSSLSGGSGVRP